MFQHHGRLEHRLPASSYGSPEAHEIEGARVFRPGWQLVASLDELPRPGSFVTRDLLGAPVIVWRTADGPQAFLNVCAHRHAMVTGAATGCVERLRCQYHGWAYDGRGNAVVIPDGASFAPLAPREFRLRQLRLEACGSLLFASLAPTGVTLREAIGASFDAVAAASSASPVDAWDAAHACNWKVVVENALESYHLPSVHPGVFEAPPERAVEHTLGAGETRFVTPDDWPRLVRLYAPDAQALYSHLHVFPALLLTSTDVYSVVHAVEPTGPRSCRSRWRVFLRDGRGARRLLRPLVRRVLIRLARRVAAEDARLYPAVQRGSDHSPHRGVLSAREERIWAFHGWLRERTAVEAGSSSR